MYSRNCITTKGALQSNGGRGFPLVLTRPGNAEGAGWRDGRRTNLSHGVPALSTSLSGSLSLHLLGAIKLNGGDPECPPSYFTHTLEHTDTLSLSISHDAEYHS